MTTEVEEPVQVLLRLPRDLVQQIDFLGIAWGLSRPKLVEKVLRERFREPDALEEAKRLLEAL